MTDKPLIVAIDGPSGVGKTTIARHLAERLNLPYLETGAMYRALGWKIHASGIDPEDRQRVEELAETVRLDLRERNDGRVEVLLDRRPLNARIRTPRVSEITSVISSYPAVRRGMVKRQREFAERRGAVVEGRDIGTRVFPDTPHKFFLTAPLAVRVSRRLRQLEETGQESLSLEALEAEVTRRDRRDRRRADSPLTRDASYMVVDTGELSIEEAVELMIGAVGESRGD